MTVHGHLLGEHGLLCKPWAGLADSNLYRELVHVPLVLYLPGAQPRHVSSFVQTVDLHPTILELLGIPYAPEQLHGRSLLPFAVGDAEPKDWRQFVVYARFGEAMNVSDQEWSLMQRYDLDRNFPTYLYSRQSPRFSENVRAIGDLQENVRFSVRVERGISQTSLFHDLHDPDQTINLASNAESTSDVQRLRSMLRDFLRKVDAPPEVIEKYTG